MARIERMNRRLSLNQCNKNTSSCRDKRFFFNDEEHQIKKEALSEPENLEVQETQDDSFPDDVPLISLAPHNNQTGITQSNSTCGDSNLGISPILLENTNLFNKN